MRKLIVTILLAFVCQYNVHAGNSSAYRLIYESPNLDGHIVIPECNPGNQTDCPCNADDVALFSFVDHGVVVANVNQRNTFVNAIAIRKFSETFPSGDSLWLGNYRYSGAVKLPDVPRRDLTQIENGEAVQMMIQFWDGRNKTFNAADSTLEATLFWELNPWSPDSGKIKIYTHGLELIETGIAVPADTLWHHFEMTVNLETHEYVSIQFDDQFADLEGVKLARVHHPDWGDDISISITAESMNTYPGPNCANIFMWSTSFKDLRFGAIIDSPCLLGDVNMDGALTPGDALCAFEIYLNEGELDSTSECLNICAYESADIDCFPNGVTPGDALIIFESYLEMKDPPLECVNTTLQKSDQHAVIRLPHVNASEDDLLEIPVTVATDASVKSFGLKFHYPADLLNFENVMSSAATAEWIALDGVESRPGMLSIGGFHPDPADFSASDVLFSIIFSVNRQGDGVGELRVSELTGDLHEAQICNGSLDVTEIQESRPGSFMLMQNYPNPFNMSTEIAYELPENTFVTLAIFNTIGQRIRRLVHGNQQRGRHVIRWDGEDEYGMSATSGIYVVRLEAAARLSVVKLILMK
jgi:hypothetical protein